MGFFFDISGQFPISIILGFSGLMLFLFMSLHSCFTFPSCISSFYHLNLWISYPDENTADPLTSDSIALYIQYGTENIF